MRVLWRKFCGLALGVALLPSLAGGGACLEHALHALTGAGSTPAAAHAGHDQRATEPQHAAHAAHTAAVATVENDAHAAHAPVVTPAEDNRSNRQATPSGSVAEAPASNCCPPSGSLEHCAGAAGCSVTAIGVAVSSATHVVVASHVLPTGGALSPPGPSRAPDVPPPRA